MSLQCVCMCVFLSVCLYVCRLVVGRTHAWSHILQSTCLLAVEPVYVCMSVCGSGCISVVAHVVLAIFLSVSSSVSGSVSVCPIFARGRRVVLAPCSAPRLPVTVARGMRGGVGAIAPSALLRRPDGRLGSAVPLVALGRCESDALALVLAFLDVSSLAVACGASRQFRKLGRSHEHWRWFVLQFFGLYYDDYMRSVAVSDEYRWHRLFLYIRQVHNNIDRKHGVRRTLPHRLRPCTCLAGGLPDLADGGDFGGNFVRTASSASSSSALPKASDDPPSSQLLPFRRRRRYRGSLELADNCNVFFWENGRHVQVVHASDGRILRDIDTGQTFRRYFHRLANVRNKLFVCLNDCIKVWEYGPDDAHKPPHELEPPRRSPGLEKVGRPLELLVHRRRLILLESNCCLLWDTDTYEFVCCIQHLDHDPTLRAGGDGAADAVPAVGGRGAVVGSRGRGHGEAGGPSAQRGQHSDEETRPLEVQWMGDLIVTWARAATQSLRVWTLVGEQRARLSTEAPLVQVDTARVTWASVKTLDHFILAALDRKSIITLWDSKEDFAPVYRFWCGCEEPFDLVLTQDFLVVVNDNVMENRLGLSFWKLWLHPDFQQGSRGASSALTPPTDEGDDALHARRATVQLGGGPAGAGLSAGGGIAPRVFVGDPFRHEQPRGVGNTGGEGSEGDGGGTNLAEDELLLRRRLHFELRQNARPIKALSIPDVDSYFASYRNFLNVCSFHKSGQESLSVYRSSSLQKKVFFPPAKHTKFEELLALQVHSDGTVVLHDFRPNQLAFDELPVSGPVSPTAGGSGHGSGSGCEERTEGLRLNGSPLGTRARTVAGVSRRARRA